MNISFPTDVPYSESQRAWLSGFFAGMKTRLLQNNTGSDNNQSSVTILYGSQTGNSESIANDTAHAIKARGLKAVVNSMNEIESADLINMATVLIITSTYGEGEMPDNAQLLWESVNNETMPLLNNLQFSVLALGDTSYDLFCQAGIDWDNRLAQLGATRLLTRVDCDVEFEEPAQQWINSIVEQITGNNSSNHAIEAENTESSIYNRKNPFPAPLSVNKLITAENSSKEIRHYELSLIGSDLSYQAGDALGVIATNNPKLVVELLSALNLNDEVLKEQLLNYYEIKLPSKELVAEIAKRSADNTELNSAIADKELLTKYLWGRDTLDLLLQNPSVNFTAEEFISLLKPLQHRAYSISSSGQLNPDSVHLTVASVRYTAFNRTHNGVCSTYLADLVSQNEPVRCFVIPNKVFKVPEDNNLPMIMVGPGTGIAPFRAFLQERQYRNAKGKNWLFFGDRNAATDFIYRDELETMQKSGLLTRLDLAFSRDQAEKIYVQDKMRENGAELFAWLEQGGYFFVCGDAYAMAKDVDKALFDIIAQHGNLTEVQANDYVNNLKKTKRYVRDVY